MVAWKLTVRIAALALVAIAMGGVVAVIIALFLQDQNPAANAQLVRAHFMEAAAEYRNYKTAFPIRILGRGVPTTTVELLMHQRFLESRCGRGGLRLMFRS
tara:strand:- start:442 stop:744 length:303 start_codon:yes stop_codon:yes gene_type:complete